MTNRELEKLFDPILEEEREKGISDLYDRIEHIVNNTNEEQFKEFIERINTKKDFLNILNNIRNELISNK